MGQPIPINLPPGVIKGESLIASGNRFTDSNNVRWVNGRPEKIGGNVAITSTPVVGKVRGVHAWGDGTGARQLIGAGTAFGLYAISNRDFAPIDITPYESIRTAGSNPFATTSGSPIVTVTLTGHGATIGRLVNFAGASAVAGLTINGNYTVVDTPTTDTFTITAASNASSSTTGGGASVVISIELADGEENISAGFGWGVGGWGEGTWGTPRDVSDVINYPRMWALDNFGKLLLANPVDRGLYSWDPTAAPVGRAIVVPDAPTQCRFMFVTSERTVFLLGTNSEGSLDRMLMHWSGQGTFDDYDTLAVASTAGGRPSGTRRLTVGTTIVAGCDLGSLLNLVWTDAALYLNQFTGGQFTYQTRKVGDNCGLLGPDAFCTIGGAAYWIGNNTFWMFNGSVSRMPNQDDIGEWLFKQLRLFYTIKTIVWHNARFNEIWFGLCLNGDVEPSTAAVFMMESQRWFICEIDRTAATQLQGDDTRPILAGLDGLFYRHDVGVNDNGAALDWYLETSILEIENGNQIYTVYGFIPDMQRQTGDIDVTLTGYERSNANAAPIDTETATATPDDGSVDFRTTARMVKMRLEGTGAGCDFRMGIPKVEVQRSGRRS
jgi:hypothetical protein